MQNFKTVCVVIPCYNPLMGWEKRLRDSYEELKYACADLNIQFSLCISIDGAAPTVSEKTVREKFPDARLLFSEKNSGKGSALRQGVAAMEADCFIMTDVDFPYTTQSIRRIIEVLIAEGGIAAGNRDTTYYKSVPRVRMLISKTLRWLLKVFLRLPVTDSQCGLKGFDSAGRHIFLETSIDRFLFDLEFLMLANKRISIHAVPVELKKGVVFSRMDMRILWRESHNFFKLFIQNMFTKR